MVNKGKGRVGGLLGLYHSYATAKQKRDIKWLASCSVNDYRKKMKWKSWREYLNIKLSLAAISGASFGSKEKEPCSSTGESDLPFRGLTPQR